MPRLFRFGFVRLCDGDVICGDGYSDDDGDWGGDDGDDGGNCGGLLGGSVFSMLFRMRANSRLVTWFLLICRAARIAVSHSFRFGAGH